MRKIRRFRRGFSESCGLATERNDFIITNMDRIDRILKHDLFIDGLNRNRAAERDRRFCRHDMTHFLDVARIARAMNAEEEIGADVELIYAAALLHDIGRHLQYSQGKPHELASAEIAPEILRDCGFDEKETCVIIEAILSHRDERTAGERSLKGLLYRADKLSRACFCCQAEPECSWKDGRKNLSLNY